MPAPSSSQHPCRPRSRPSTSASRVATACRRARLAEQAHPWIAWASPYSTRLNLGPHPLGPTLRALYPSGPTLEGRALRYRRLPHPGASHSMVCAAGGSPAPAQVARCPLRARLRRSIAAGAHAQRDLLRLPGARGRPQQLGDSPRLRAQLCASELPHQQQHQLLPLRGEERTGRGDARLGRQVSWHRARHRAWHRATFACTSHIVQYIYHMSASLLRLLTCTALRHMVD